MLASFDIGIKHLAVCILDQEVVKLWSVLDLVSEPVLQCCSAGCKHPAKFTQDSQGFCKRCAKAIPEFFSLQQVTKGSLRSMKLASLRELLAAHDGDAPRTKANCLVACQGLLKVRKFYPVERPNSKKSADLPTVGKRMMIALDECLAKSEILHSQITRVAIENQVGPIASTMKAVQGMVTQYWIMRQVEDIVYVSAANKLKPFTSEQLSYKQRKKLAIEKTAECIASGPNAHLSGFFEGNKKQDDLADAYLQGRWVLREKA